MADPSLEPRLRAGLRTHLCRARAPSCAGRRPSERAGYDAPLRRPVRGAPARPRRARRGRSGGHRLGQDPRLRGPCGLRWRSQHRGRSKRPTILVLTPTRELAAQVAEVAREVARAPRRPRRGVLRRHPHPQAGEAAEPTAVDLLIATPGRLIDLHERRRRGLRRRAPGRRGRGRPDGRHGLRPAGRLAAAPPPGRPARPSSARPPWPATSPGCRRTGSTTRSSSVSRSAARRPGTLVHRFLYVHGADKDRVAARIIRSLRPVRRVLRHQA